MSCTAAPPMMQLSASPDGTHLEAVELDARGASCTAAHRVLGAVRVGGDGTHLLSVELDAPEAPRPVPLPRQ